MFPDALTQGGGVGLIPTHKTENRVHSDTQRFATLVSFVVNALNRDKIK